MTVCRIKDDKKIIVCLTFKKIDLKELKVMFDSSQQLMDVPIEMKMEEWEFC